MIGGWRWTAGAVHYRRMEAVRNGKPSLQLTHSPTHSLTQTRSTQRIRGGRGVCAHQSIGGSLGSWFGFLLGVASVSRRLHGSRFAIKSS
uniref:Uncharacterized protein n=1 Tax=Oryza brachyantha TaxID=4533 RepID=J3MMC4_ORYBR